MTPELHTHLTVSILVETPNRKDSDMQEVRPYEYDTVEELIEAGVNAPTSPITGVSEAHGLIVEHTASTDRNVRIEDGNVWRVERVGMVRVLRRDGEVLAARKLLVGEDDPKVLRSAIDSALSEALSRIGIDALERKQQALDEVMAHGSSLRQERNDLVRSLAAQDVSAYRLAQLTGMSQTQVTRIIRGER